ncbi:MAG: arsenite methyltransferase [Armatimonadota bacterium]|nr:arsenite methyltransferase [Armatimonadota bacterium]
MFRDLNGAQRNGNPETNSVKQLLRRIIMQSDKKKWVRERYGEIAGQTNSSGCCSQSSCGCDQASVIAQEAGYEAEALDSVPEGANLGLGCGNLVAIAGIKEGEVVLDLGSGAGLDAFLAADRVGKSGKVIGVDMTPEMIEAARRNIIAGGYTNVEFRQGDIEALPVEDNSVDLVISNCVLNLVPDKNKAFAEIYRALKPGGRFAIADIVLDGPLPAELLENEAAYCACASGAISRADYLKGLMDAGLNNVRVESEADASELLSSGCGCGGGGDRMPDLKGVVTSVKVTGRKPSCCGGCC